MDKKKSIGDSIIGLTALLSAFAFLFIGFVMHVWHPTWLIFLSIPLVALIVDIATKKNDLRGVVPGIVSIACAVVYLYLGLFENLWHPGWLVFFAIPISSVITDMFAKKNPEDAAQTKDVQD